MMFSSTVNVLPIITFPVLVSMVAKLELKSTTNTIQCSLDTVSILVRGVIMYILLLFNAAEEVVGCMDENDEGGGVGVASLVVVPEDAV